MKVPLKALYLQRLVSIKSSFACKQQFLFQSSEIVQYATPHFSSISSESDTTARETRSNEQHGRHQSSRKPSTMHEYLYGRSVCQMALESSKRPIFKLLAGDHMQHALPKDPRLLSILSKAAERNIPIEYKSSHYLHYLSDGRPHQGVCLQVGRLSLLRLRNKILTELLSSEWKSCPLWVLLDRISDPMNVGAILRTCYFLGVDKVILSPQSSPITAVVSKASSGAAEVIPMYSVINSVDFVQVLLGRGWEVIGTDVINETDEDEITLNSAKTTDAIGLSSFQITKPSLLVLGSEGSGILESIKRKCSTLLTIHSKNRSDGLELSCLNVSAAAAIILHKLTEDR